MKRRFPAQFRPAAITAIGLILASPALSIGQAPNTSSSSASVTPVLVELFTSEGCSDCPPADNLLARLDREQPIPGVHVIVLSEHVTYWNHDGWTDPFSMTEMDERQNDYVVRFHLQSSYTPQAVVDGAEQMVGSNGPQLVRAVEHEASLPGKSLAITAANMDKGSVHFSLQAPDGKGDHLYAVVAQDVARSEVPSGENAGRTLHHVAVVREIRALNSKDADGRQISISTGSVDRHPGSGAVRLVVFLQDPRSGRVEAAAEQPLSAEQTLSRVR
ncbi:MAG TPA: DUF1223 domain-containing protein [Terracidiphilus sp.]|nr:DUF1223 domain-containing protein [Terracidiphilus sp.]